MLIFLIFLEMYGILKTRVYIWLLALNRILSISSKSKCSRNWESHQSLWLACIYYRPPFIYYGSIPMDSLYVLLAFYLL